MDGHHLLGPLLVAAGVAIILVVALRVLPATAVVGSDAWNEGGMRRSWRK